MSQKNYLNTNVTTLSNEELLKNIENSLPNYNHDSISVYSFVSYYKIASGKYPVNKRLLWMLYKNWTDKPIKVTVFYSRLSSVLGPSINDKYFLCLNSLTISKKVLEYLNSTSNRVTGKRNVTKKHIEKFISYYEIKPGNYKITNISLFYLYDKLVYDNKCKELSLKLFTNLMKQYLKYEYTKYRLVTFKITTNISKFITKKEETQILQGYKQKFYEKKEKSKQKEKSKISST